MKINKGIIVISETDDEVLLKIGNTNQIIRLKPIEFKIIKYYAGSENNMEVISHFQDKIEIEEGDLNTLTEKAKALKILVPETYKYPKNRWVKFKFKRNKKIIEIFTIDFSGSLLERFIENKHIIIFFFYAFLPVLLFIAYEIVSSPLNFRGNYFATLYAVPISFGSLIGYVYMASFLAVCFHEVGHYAFYKLYNGKGSTFGFGLLLLFFPVFYNKVIISSIKEKRKKIITYLGGIIFDTFLILLMLIFTKKYAVVYPTTSFLCYTTMISICIRSFFNINFFIPNTDGYFIFSSLVKKPMLFNLASNIFKTCVSKKRIRLKEVPLMLYAICSYLSILIHLTFFPITILFAYLYASKS